MADIRVRHDALQAFITAAFVKAGMPARDAEFSAWCLVQSDLWGIYSHGVIRFPMYLTRLCSRAVNPAPNITNKLHDALPVAHLDGDEGLGYVVGRAGMELAISKARAMGVSFVLTSNSNHYGAAGIYARMAAEQGLLGLSVTNVMPNVGMPGSTLPSTGNNPVAMAAPIPGRDPFCIDVAMSLVAQGKLIYAAKKGAPVPDTWALAPDGTPTTDPKAGLAGMLLPTGMHKGFGISLFIDIITGLLGGGPFLNQIYSMYKRPDAPSRLAHVFCALNPDMFMPRAEFESNMTQWHAIFKSTPVQPGMPPLIMPGEPEAEADKKNRASGLTLPEQLWADFAAIAKEHNLPLPEEI